MSYDGPGRNLDEPLPLPSPPINRPDLVCCPHCRGTGLVLRNKLSPGQLKKCEQDSLELERERERYHEREGPSRPTVYYRRSDPEIEDYPQGDQDDNWRRNKPSRWQNNQPSRRQNPEWRGENDTVWQDPPRNDDFPSEQVDGQMSKNQRRQQRKRQRKREEFNRMNDTDSRFPSQLQSSLSVPPARYDYREEDYNNPPQSLMPLPSTSAGNDRQRQGQAGNHPPRKRQRQGNRQQYGSKEQMSEMDIFSLGILYASYMQ